MTTPKRSERLAPKLAVTYMNQFFQFEKDLNKSASSTKMASSLAPEKKIQNISKLVKLLTTNFVLIKQFEPEKYDIMFKTVYKKSFEWIRSAKNYNIQNVSEIIKAFKKFRKKYETSRYAKWEFLRIQFNLDANLMFIIDSYM
jgi:hypothetical protein